MVPVCDMAAAYAFSAEVTVWLAALEQMRGQYEGNRGVGRGCQGK
jgi:hypothetical protein